MAGTTPFQSESESGDETCEGADEGAHEGDGSEGSERAVSKGAKDGVEGLGDKEEGEDEDRGWEMQRLKQHLQAQRAEHLPRFWVMPLTLGRGGRHGGPSHHAPLPHNHYHAWRTRPPNDSDCPT